MEMTEHASKQYDLDLGSIRSRVLAMGGLVESQIRRAIDALTTGNVALSDEVIEADHRVNAWRWRSTATAASSSCAASPRQATCA